MSIAKADREKIFQEVTEKILKKYPRLQSAHDIDNGYCDEWADEVRKRIPSAEMIDTPIDYYDGPGHVWVWIQGLNFDAETTEGVTDWHNLKIFRKH